ncbi:uncharacterized protein LOC144435484 [Glandiceps talaboti]
MGQPGRGKPLKVGLHNCKLCLVHQTKSVLTEDVQFGPCPPSTENNPRSLHSMMDKLVLIFQLVVIIQTSTAQTNDEDGQCLSICSNSWPDTRGPAGPPGQPGAPGIAGPVGRQGQPGVIGPAGTQGVKGEPGYKGEIGSIGQPGTGVKGQTGRPGKVGPQGAKGDKGVNGLNGTDGFHGVKGDNGMEGLRGPVGPSGVKGDKGTVGMKGSVGLTGVKGEKGEIPTQVKVAFSVARQNGMSGTGSEQTITYTHSILQENANIDINTGVFTCQVPGIYYFSFTFFSYSGKYLLIALKLNNDDKFVIYQTSLSGHRMQSQSGMLHLDQSDQVKLVLGANTIYRFHYRGNSHCNTFNGYLIS